jgi:hypothetical protein
MLQPGTSMKRSPKHEEQGTGISGLEASASAGQRGHSAITINGTKQTKTSRFGI